MNRLELKQTRRIARKKHVRKNIIGTKECPRVSVFKSNKNLSVQVIDDSQGFTMLSVSTLEKDLKELKPNIKDGAKLGKILGDRLKAAKIKTVVFDRNGYKYHGVVKAIADATRESGIQF